MTKLEAEKLVDKLVVLIKAVIADSAPRSDVEEAIALRHCAEELVELLVDEV